jgi:hypothetical protein
VGLINIKGNMMSNFCEDCKDDDVTPCCDYGTCEAADCYESDKDGAISNCIHCGGEMFKDRGVWFHHEQADIPFDERLEWHDGP